MLQAFIDDSFDSDGTHVLAGCIASAESWANFAAEWERLLPLATRGKNGKWRFKMSEMAQTEERMSRVPAFFRVMEQHVPIYISAAINANDLKRALARVNASAPLVKVNWGQWGKAWFVAFRALMDMFHVRRRELDPVFGPDEKVDFYFDERQEKKRIWATWDDYVKKRSPETRRYYGSPPRFEDEEDFLPLQAGDFWAWWTRKWIGDGTPQKAQAGDFGTFQRTPDISGTIIAISFTEDQLVESFDEMLTKQLPGTPRVQSRRIKS